MEFSNDLQLIRFTSPPRMPVTNEGLGWDSLLKMEESWKTVTATGWGGSSCPGSDASRPGY